MRELSVQSSNDSNNDNDRAELQKEFDQLSEEITRISTDTEFNTKKLIDGTATDLTFHIGANTDQNITLAISDMGAENLKVGTVSTAATDNGDKILKNEAGDTVGTWQAAQEGAKAGEVKTPAVVDGDGNETTPAVLYDEDQPATVAGYYNGDKLVKAAAAALEDDAKVTSGINISDKASANTAITTIQTAIDTVSAERSKLGAYQNRL